MSRSGSLKIPQTCVCSEGFVWSDDHRRSGGGGQTERTSDRREQRADSVLQIAQGCRQQIREGARHLCITGLSYFCTSGFKKSLR